MSLVYFYQPLRFDKDEINVINSYLDLNESSIIMIRLKKTIPG